MIKAVIFDLDDTLISEKQYIKSAYKHISKLLCSKFNVEGKEIYKSLIELFTESPREVFNRLFDEYNIICTKDIILELVEEYRNHFPQIEFFDDVLPCIDLLKEKGIKTGIITDGYKNSQRQKLNAVKAYDYFDEIIITDELGKEYWKPHPKAFEMMRKKLEVEYEQMIYVGDNPEKDFYISKLYPIKTVRVYREGLYGNSLYHENIKEHVSIYGLNEISEYIRFKF